MGEIGQTADSILVASSEVASGHLDLSQRIGHVSQSVGALEEMTQQNAALVQEGATAADSLKDQAGRLTRDGGDDHRWGAAAPSASPMAVPTRTTAPRPLASATSRAPALPRS